MDEGTEDSPQPEPSGRDLDLIHLPALISEHFGVSRSSARMTLALSTLEIDGEIWHGDPFDIPRWQLEGRELRVYGEGQTQGYKFRYERDEEERLR